MRHSILTVNLNNILRIYQKYILKFFLAELSYNHMPMHRCGFLCNTYYDDWTSQYFRNEQPRL